MMDNYGLWEMHDYEQQKELEKCPVCVCCGEYIQDDYYYKIEEEILCLDCLNENYRHSTY